MGSEGTSRNRPLASLVSRIRADGVADGRLSPKGHDQYHAREDLQLMNLRFQGAAQRHEYKLPRVIRQIAISLLLVGASAVAAGCGSSVSTPNTSVASRPLPTQAATTATSPAQTYSAPSETTAQGNTQTGALGSTISGVVGEQSGERVENQGVATITVDAPVVGSAFASSPGASCDQQLEKRGKNPAGAFGVPVRVQFNNTTSTGIELEIEPGGVGGVVGSAGHVEAGGLEQVWSENGQCSEAQPGTPEDDGPVGFAFSPEQTIPGRTAAWEGVLVLLPEEKWASTTPTALFQRLVLEMPTFRPEDDPSGTWAPKPSSALVSCPSGHRGMPLMALDPSVALARGCGHAAAEVLRDN